MSVPHFVYLPSSTYHRRNNGKQLSHHLWASHPSWSGSTSITLKNMPRIPERPFVGKRCINLLKRVLLYTILTSPAAQSIARILSIKLCRNYWTYCVHLGLLIIRPT